MNNDQECKVAYRIYQPHQYIPDNVSETVRAASVKEAMRLLGTRNISNLQRFVNGSWVWVA